MPTRRSGAPITIWSIIALPGNIIGSAPNWAIETKEIHRRFSLNPGIHKSPFDLYRTNYTFDEKNTLHTPSYYKIEDEAIIDRFLRDHSFGTLISVGSPYPLATHIPMELETNSHGKSVLRGHISRANPQWQSWTSHPQVLAVFLSPIHHYISSSWYNHPNVPTWNYMSVQVSGDLSIVEGEELKESLRRLTDKYESGSEHPISLDTLPLSVQNQMKGVVGFEIEIVRKEASFKLSQNRNEEDFNNIIHQLKNSGRSEAVRMAEIMEKIR